MCLLFVCSLSLFQVGSPVPLRFFRQHWESMAGRGRKGKEQQPTDAQELSEGGEPERSFLEMFMAAQAKRDEENVERARQERIEAEERAEARRLKAEIAAEEREERRREREEERKEKASMAEAERLATARLVEEERLMKAKQAEEERLEARALEKEKRKREEAVRLEEAAKLAYDQQKEAIELQAELGRKAAEALRLESQRVRLKDRAVASISAWQSRDDLEEFLLSSERKLRAGNVPDGEWLGIMAAKLSGEVGATWQELCLTLDQYLEVRAAVLMGCGYTQKAAGEAFHAFRYDNLKGMSADQVYRKGCQLVRRMVAPTVLDKETEFRLVRPWVYSCIGRKAKAGLEARVIESGEDLVRGLQDHLAMDGDKLSGKVAVFSSEGTGSRRPTYGVGSGTTDGRKGGGALGTSSGALKCFKCGKLGHKAADCWQGTGKPVEGSTKIICFICGVEGHKATTCPSKKNETQKGGVAKPVRQLRLRESVDTVMKGTVNGQGASLLLDSGANITVVPESMVDECDRDGRSVCVKAFQSEECIRMATAKVKFGVDGMDDWEEVVALAPVEQGKESEVLYGLKLRTPRGLDLVLLANGLDEVRIRRVTTRSEAKLEASKREEEARVVGVERPRVKSTKTCSGKAPVRRPVSDGAKAVEAVVEAAEAVEPVKRMKAPGKAPVGKPRLRGSEAAEAVTRAVKAARNRRVEGAVGPKPSSSVKKAPVRAPVKRPGAGEAKAVEAAEPSVQQAQKKKLEAVDVDKSLGTGDGGLTVDRPVRNPEPVASDESSDEEEEWPDLESLAGTSEDSEVEVTSSETEVVSEDQEEIDAGVEYCLRKGGRLEDLRVPPVQKGSESRAKLMEEVKTDPTLDGYRALAMVGEQGFRWSKGLLYQARMDNCEEVIHVLVLPKSVRKRVLKMAHEGSGHLGARKVQALLRQRFVWPSMGVDIIAHTRSCEVCQRCAKPKSRRVPLMERKVLSEPFEVMAFDLVGPFPKAKNGYRFVLTAICMGSKWPEAIPLKAQTARAVANGMMEIFSRTGIPLQLLTDQGSQFLGSLVKHLCRDLGIDQIKTTPYHPECNGVVERMHGTLVPMLTKASRLGLDWVEQLPFALFALRSAPNRDTKFSPYQLVYGHRVRTPLDILHQGWAEEEFGEFDTAEWADWLVSRLAVWHESVLERGKEASGNRKAWYDKSTVNRTLSVGDQVMCRIPGMIGKLKESWHGPYDVVARKSRVDYVVNLGKGKGRVKVLHINNLKKYFPRPEKVLRLALVAEDWAEDECVERKLSGSYDGFDEKSVVNELKKEFPEVFSDLPGKAKVGCFKIETGDAEPRRSHPYRVPDRLKEGVRSEVNKLVELGIVVPSTSPWASPVVPVPKTDGTVRVCVDYRKLNEVTTSDPYYMTCMDEILERVGGSKIISKLDLVKGFYQVEVDPSSQCKTAFVSPYGKFEFQRMPFGLKNAPAAFQRMMVVLGDCYECSAPYIDDVVVFSNSGEEHVQHLRCVLECLRKFGLTIKEAKYEWGKVKLEYLGHVIGGGELAVPAHRAAAMANYIRPKTKKQLRSFLGAAGYYRQFVQGFAKLSSVLTPLTSKSAPSVVCWTAEGLEAFTGIKVSLVDVCSLVVPSQQEDFVLHCDASGAGIGATLNVVRDGKKLPVAFYSKQLQGAQHRYSATELEGLAVFKAVHFFAHYLFGCKFVVVTDHKALVRFLHSRVLNRQLHGWMLQLLQFDFVIQYRPGEENGDADALSRQAWDTGVDGHWLTELDADGRDDGDATGLRPAPSLFVGGDVGTETPQKKEEPQEVWPSRRNQKEGVATCGVALQN